MTKLKSCVITGIVAFALFCALYLSSSYAIRWYNTFKTIFATYGYIQAICIFYKWIREPSVEPRHVECEVASGKTIPNSWINPFSKVKEKNDGSDTANARTTQDGLSNARNNPDRAESVSSGSLGTVWTCDGDYPTEHYTENSAAAG